MTPRVRGGRVAYGPPVVKRTTTKSDSQRTKNLPLEQRSSYVHGRIRQILRALREADHNLAVKEISTITNILDPAISEYLRTARKANLVEMVGRGAADKRLHLYRITPAGDAFLDATHREPQADQKEDQTP